MRMLLDSPWAFSSSPEEEYESLGFRAWGREPESLEVDGRRYDEIFLALRLQPERDR